MKTQSKFNEVYRDEINKVAKEIKKDIQKIQRIPKYSIEMCEYAKEASYFKGAALKDRYEEEFEGCEYFDVNSMYPSMWGPGYIYPKGNLLDKLEGVYGKRWEDVADRLKGRCGFVMINLDIDTMTQRYDLDYGDLFIGDTIDYSFSTGEVVEIERNLLGHVEGSRYTLFLDNTHMEAFLKLYEVEYYIVYIKVFAETFSWDERVLGVFESYKEKANAVKGEDPLAAKIIKNAINKAAYGKIVQRNYSLSCKLRKERLEGSFVLGLWITGYAMLKELEQIIKHVDTFVYADTDSIILKKGDVLDVKEVDAVKLGYYKHEYSGVHLEIADFKFYRISKDGVVLKETNQVKPLEVTDMRSRVKKALKGEEYWEEQEQEEVMWVDIDEESWDTFAD